MFSDRIPLARFADMVDCELEALYQRYKRHPKQYPPRFKMAGDRRHWVMVADVEAFFAAQRPQAQKRGPGRPRKDPNAFPSMMGV